MASIQAKITHAPDDGPMVPAFEAARDDIPRLLELFRDGVPDPAPATNWMRLGEIRIAMTDGSVTVVELFWTGVSRGAYRFNGRWVRGSTDRAIRDAIVECAKRGRMI